MLKPTTENRGNTLVICQLALERSRASLAQLLAIMHLCEPESLGLEPELAETARNLLASIDQELSRSVDMLGFQG